MLYFMLYIRWHGEGHTTYDHPFGDCDHGGKGGLGTPAGERTISSRILIDLGGPGKCALFLVNIISFSWTYFLYASKSMHYVYEKRFAFTESPTNYEKAMRKLMLSSQSLWRLTSMMTNAFTKWMAISSVAFTMYTVVSMI